MGSKRNRNRVGDRDPTLITVDQSVERFGTVYLSHAAIRGAIGIGRPIMVDDTLIGFDGDADIGINMTYYCTVLPRDFQRTFDRFVMPMLQSEIDRVLSGSRMSRTGVLDLVAELCERIFVPRVGAKTQDPKAVTKLRSTGITAHAFEIMGDLQGPSVGRGIRFASPEDIANVEVIDVEVSTVVDDTLDDDDGPTEEELLEQFEFPEAIMRAQAAGPFPNWFMIGELLAAAVNGWSYAKYYAHVSDDHPNEPIESMECLLEGTEPELMRRELPKLLAQTVQALMAKFAEQQMKSMWGSMGEASRATVVADFTCDILRDALKQASGS